MYIIYSGHTHPLSLSSLLSQSSRQVPLPSLSVLVLFCNPVCLTRATCGSTYASSPPTPFPAAALAANRGSPFPVHELMLAGLGFSSPSVIAMGSRVQWHISHPEQHFPAFVPSLGRDDMDVLSITEYSPVTLTSHESAVSAIH